MNLESGLVQMTQPSLGDRVPYRVIANMRRGDADAHFLRSRRTLPRFALAPRRWTVGQRGYPFRRQVAVLPEQFLVVERMVGEVEGLSRTDGSIGIARRTFQ